ncbi:Predicted RNA-binding protein, contains PUA-like domain [Myxococcus fulvus]|uniref:Predicted RNA-binding protein, contains PUA-like domain n=1 Tax=Myxococcus fulvus TaxID=33 RepID=A0A511TBJ8_MYXFU|nr:EVE domain-containing protein [Myxococcus fulvus]GEN11561.1 ubiquinol-cytochrome c reductase [Myxococcus fulvus]SEU11935.1 Predicted RNA-binding protein, contains PUA-like domain [Myxococcus fulvus]
MSKTQYWLIKSEPSVYPYAQLEKDKQTEWTGIRSFEARNNLRAMKPGDLCLYYHSNEGKAVVGVAQVLTLATEDSTAPGEDWASVKVAAVIPVKAPVELGTVKATAALKDFPLITRSRLSVAPVTAEHFKLILKMGKTALPK